MKPRPLSETNSYLIDASDRSRLVARSVRTSGGVEGIKEASSSKTVHIEIPRRKDKKIYQISKSTAQAK